MRITTCQRFLGLANVGGAGAGVPLSTLAAGFYGDGSAGARMRTKAWRPIVKAWLLSRHGRLE